MKFYAVGLQLYLKRLQHRSFPIFKNTYKYRIEPGNCSFRDHVQGSMKIMHGLHKLIFSTNEMVLTSKQYVHWWKESVANFI